MAAAQGLKDIYIVILEFPILFYCFDSIRMCGLLRRFQNLHVTDFAVRGSSYIFVSALFTHVRDL